MKPAVNHRQAFENPSLRQAYLNEIVTSSGRTFPAVSSFRYLTEQQRQELDARLYRNPAEVGVEERKSASAVCSLDGLANEAKTASIFLLENHFNPVFNVLYRRGLQAEDVDLVTHSTICEHEASHAEHFTSHSIPGVSLPGLDLMTKEGSVLFTVASELEAHRREIIYLGNQKAKTNYPFKHQEFLLKCYSTYLIVLKQLDKKGIADSAKIRQIFEQFKRLEYKSTPFELYLFP